MLGLCWAYVKPLLAHLGVCWRLSGLTFQSQRKHGSVGIEFWVSFGLMLGHLEAMLGVCWNIRRCWNQIWQPTQVWQPGCKRNSLYVGMYVCMYTCMYICTKEIGTTTLQLAQKQVQLHCSWPYLLCIKLNVCTYVCVYVCMYVCMYVCIPYMIVMAYVKHEASTTPKSGWCSKIMLGYRRSYKGTYVVHCTYL